MNDELVKWLRELASIPAHCENVADCDQCSKEDICLSFTNERIIETATQAADAIEKLSKPHWISVEEQLPESGVHVLLACKTRGGNKYVCDGFHTEKFSQPTEFYEDIDADYSEETDEYYFPEGWWEVIKNWDDYSCVAIEDTVTHWMPLPEPPKEE